MHEVGFGPKLESLAALGVQSLHGLLWSPNPEPEILNPETLVMVHIHISGFRESVKPKPQTFGAGAWGSPKLHSQRRSSALKS